MSDVSETLLKGVRAVIFDLDDTLILSTVDYGKFKRQVIQRIVEEGEPESDYDPNELIVDIIARYENALRSKRLSDSEVKVRVAALNDIMDSVELERVSETAPIDGASDVLALLRASGMKVGILTRGCERYAKAALERVDMLGFVDGIEGRNSETKPKPDPGSYLRLVQALGVGPAETIFVGDHPMDAHCAANAGARFVGVMTGDVPEQKLLDAGSIAVFPSVGQMLSWFRDGLYH